MVRLFVAFPVPSEVPLELQQKFSAYDLMPVKEFHLTLKFLGDVEKHKIPAIIERLHQVQAPMLTLSLSHLDIFLDLDGKPRVLWVALQPEEILLELHHNIEDVLQGLFPREPNYTSHLTLGRFRSDKNLSSLPSVLKMILPAFSFTIKAFCLYKSEQRENSIYTHIILARFPLHS